MDEQRIIYEEGEEQARIAEIIHRDEIQAEEVVEMVDINDLCREQELREIAFTRQRRSYPQNWRAIMIPVIELKPEVLEPEEPRMSIGVTLPWHIYYVNPNSGMSEKFLTIYSHRSVAIEAAEKLINDGKRGVRVVHFTLPPIAY